MRPEPRIETGSSAPQAGDGRKGGRKSSFCKEKAEGKTQEKKEKTLETPLWPEPYLNDRCERPTTIHHRKRGGVRPLSLFWGKQRAFEG